MRGNTVMALCRAGVLAFNDDMGEYHLTQLAYDSVRAIAASDDKC